MHWVIQTNIFKEPALADLAKSLVEQGVTFSFHRVEPFEGIIYPDISPDGNVMVMGTAQMKKVADRKGWIPGIFNVSDISYQELIDNWGRTVLNYDMSLQRFDSVIPPSDPFFIKPDTEVKLFKGMTITVEEFQRWQLQMYGSGTSSSDDNRNIRPGTMVVVSPVKQILKEIRFWIVDSCIATQSEYQCNGEVCHLESDDSNASEFVYRRLSQWQPSRAFVLDVALMADNEWKVIEINTLNFSGLYKANVSNIIRHIEMMRF